MKRLTLTPTQHYELGLITGRLMQFAAAVDRDESEMDVCPAVIRLRLCVKHLSEVRNLTSNQTEGAGGNASAAESATSAPSDLFPTKRRGAAGNGSVVGSAASAPGDLF